MNPNSTMLLDAVTTVAKRFDKVAHSNGRGAVYFDLGFFSLEFFHPERWSEDVSCVFSFDRDVSFLFEDVSSVVNKRANVKSADHGLGFIGVVSDFIAENFEELTQQTSKWFLPAAETAYKRCKIHFPEIAEAELNNAKRIADNLKPPFRIAHLQ